MTNTDNDEETKESKLSTLNFIGAFTCLIVAILLITLIGEYIALSIAFLLAITTGCLYSNGQHYSAMEDIIMGTHVVNTEIDLKDLSDEDKEHVKRIFGIEENDTDNTEDGNGNQ